VTWTFESLTHTVAFDGTSGSPTNIGNSTNTEVSRVFNTAGTFNYQCTIHGGMTGKVIVH
jgi:plastocyanin